MQMKDRMKPMLTKEEREACMEALRQKALSKEKLDTLREVLLKAEEWDNERFSKMPLEKIYAELIEESPDEMMACEERLCEIIATAKEGEFSEEESNAIWKLYMETMEEHPDWRGYEDGIIGQIQDMIDSGSESADNAVIMILGPDKAGLYKRIKKVLELAAEERQRVSVFHDKRLDLQIEPKKYDIDSMLNIKYMAMQFLSKEGGILIFETFGESRIMIHAMIYMRDKIMKVPHDLLEEFYNETFKKDGSIDYLFF